MEVLDSAILKSSTCCFTPAAKFSGTSKISCFSGSQVCFRKGNQIPSLRNSSLKAGVSGFDDKGHVEYYSRFSPICGEKKGKGKGKKGSNGISTKKRAKLLKGLVEDLSTLTDLGFVGDEKSVVISQTAETLLTQLKQIRAEEEEQMKCNSKDCESSSSSSLSESSDSECDDEVIDMKSVKNKTFAQPITTTNEIHPVNEAPLSTTPSTLEEKYPIQQSSQTSEQKCSNMILNIALKMAAESDVLDTKSHNSLHQPKAEEKKIEVCMGGKCKKLGAPALMKEFERVMGDEGVVEGCKCMGKCKSAPNVRAVNGNLGDDSLKIATKSLCTSVGLGDVEMIVANYFGGESFKGQLCVAAVPY